MTTRKRRTRKRRTPDLTIGWREWLALPELGIERIKAKIDTGARSSVLHAYDISAFERDGISMVRFKVHPIQRTTSVTIAAEARLVDERTVRSSVGHEQLRPVIETEVLLMGARFPAELTLTRRDQMGFRMLLGRQAIRRRFLVDASRSFLADKLESGDAPKGES